MSITIKWVAEQAGKIMMEHLMEENRIEHLKEWIEYEAEAPAQRDDGSWYDKKTGLDYDESFIFTESLSSKVCDETLERIKEAEEFGGRPLKGSRKQKEWAEIIRSGILSKCDTKISKELCCRDDELLSESRFWIENKHKDVTQFVNFVTELDVLRKICNKAEHDMHTKLLDPVKMYVGPIYSKIFREAVARENELLKDWI